MCSGTQLERYLVELLGNAGYKFDEPHFEAFSYVRRAELAPGLVIEYDRQIAIPQNCPGRTVEYEADVQIEDMDFGDGEMEYSFKPSNRYIETIRLKGHDEDDGEEFNYQSIEHFSCCGPNVMNRRYEVPFYLGINLHELLCEAYGLQPQYAMRAPFTKLEAELNAQSRLGIELPDMSPPPFPDMGPPLMPDMGPPPMPEQGPPVLYGVGAGNKPRYI
jgi:hypothetical protein